LPESVAERLKLIDKDCPKIAVSRQCELLGANRSMVYYQPAPVPESDLFLMARIDKLYTAYPFYGAPRLTKHLNIIDKIAVNHKKVERLMGLMGIAAIYPRKKWNTSQPDPKHQKFPYLLNEINVKRPDQVWGTDITYIQANKNWYYLVAIMDWFSRYVVSWRLSESLTTDFCVLNLQQALKVNLPEIHNSDQGSQFTANNYLKILQQHSAIHISMDGRGRCFDNIFNERLWRSVKYEEVYLKDYQSFAEAQAGLDKYFKFYNTIRLHSSLNDQTPEQIYFKRSKSISSNH
jgi:putative transposase